MKVAKLPGLPAPRFSDPALQRWAEAVSERLEVREGTRGDILEKVVTRRELAQYAPLISPSSASAPRSQGVRALTADTGSALLQAMDAEAFANKLRGSKLLRELQTSVSASNRFAKYGPEIQALQRSITSETTRRGAQVARAELLINEVSRSLVGVTSEMTAALNTTAAGIRSTQFAIATESGATAGQVTQLEARMRVAVAAEDLVPLQPAAAYSDFAALESAVSAASADTRKYYRVQDGVNEALYRSDGSTWNLVGSDQSAKLEQVLLVTADKTDGLSAQYTLKVNAGKAIAGYGIAATERDGVPESSFIIQADTFALIAAVNFSQEATPSATVIGQLWYVPSTELTYRATATGTGSWTLHTPIVPFGIDTLTNTTYVTGSLRVGNSAGNTLSAVNSSAVNFDGRNDRNPSAVLAPTIASDGTAIDHTTNTDGSVDVSFEWSWAGSEGDIDGFIITAYSATTGAAYTLGTTPAAESEYFVPASKRALIGYGYPADHYYRLGVQAYRIVDPDINAAGIIRSTRVIPSLGAENPYQPAANVAFAGNITGTVGGVAAVTLTTQASNGNNALIAINDGTTGLATKMGTAQKNVLSGVGGIKVGTIDWDAAGTVTSGSGTAMTSKGFVGRNASGITFSIDATTGNLIVKGDITGSTGSFGAVTVGASGSISAGKTTFTDVVNAGYFIDNAAGGRMVFGTTAANMIKWDGSALTINGTVASTVVSNAALATTALQATNFNTTLAAQLTSGTNNLILATSASTHKIQTTTTSVLFRDNNAVVGSLGPTTAGNKLGLGINSSGIIGGYNAATTGTWNTTFLMDVSTGNLTVGKGSSALLYTAATGVMSLGSGITIAANGNATFAGALSAATGTFAGSLAAATGTFAGSLSAATGTFAGSLSAATGSFGAVTVGASGSISAGKTTFTDVVNAGYFIDNAAGGRMVFGTTAANMIKWDGAALTINGTTASTVVSNAASGKSISDKLLSNGSTILTGTITPTNTGGIRAGSITWNSTTGALTGGSGIAITEAGIIGATGGVPTFTISSATGAATFAGALSAATGSFAGSLSAATGTFAGSLSAATGTFAGSLSAGTISAGSLAVLSGSSIIGDNWVTPGSASTVAFGVDATAITRYANHSAMAEDFAVVAYTLTVRDGESNVFTTELRQSLYKSTTGFVREFGSDGYTVKLKAGASGDSLYIAYGSDNALLTPASISITATKVSGAAGDAYCEFFVNGVSTGAPALMTLVSDSYISTYTLVSPPTYYAGLTSVVEVRMRKTSATGAVVARHRLQVKGVKDGSLDLVTVLTNEFHVIPDPSGVPDYAGSGTDIMMAIGVTPLNNAVSGAYTYSITATGRKDFDPASVINNRSTEIDGSSIRTGSLRVNDLSALSASTGDLIVNRLRTAVTGFRVELEKDSDFPIWYGTGTKNVANAKFYLDSAGVPYFNGALGLDTQVSDGTSSVSLLKGGQVIECTDGVAVTFPTGFPAGTSIGKIKVIWLGGGITYSPALTGVQGRKMQTSGMSLAGFTPVLKLTELAASLTARSYNFTPTPGTPSIATKVLAANAWNNVYTAAFTVAITGETNEYFGIQGSCDVILEAKTSVGSYAIVDSRTYTSAHDGSITTYSGQTLTATFAAAGADALFRLTVSLFIGTATLTTTTLTYSEATAPAEISLTPTGASPVSALVLLVD